MLPQCRVCVSTSAGVGPGLYAPAVCLPENSQRNLYHELAFTLAATVDTSFTRLYLILCISAHYLERTIICACARSGCKRGFTTRVCAGAQTSVAGWLEAFGAHPRIGDAASLKAKLGGFADMSRHEQAAAADAPDEVFQVRAHPTLRLLHRVRARSISNDTGRCRVSRRKYFWQQSAVPCGSCRRGVSRPFCLPPLLP